MPIICTGCYQATLFFDYVVATSRDTKMPRGDKAAIMKFDTIDMSIEDQYGIAMIFNLIREMIELNQQLNDCLAAWSTSCIVRFMSVEYSATSLHIE